MGETRFTPGPLLIGPYVADRPQAYDQPQRPWWLGRDDMRWMPYSPNSEQYRAGLLGRVQHIGCRTGRWQNCRGETAAEIKAALAKARGQVQP
jgi:hypothetical protein